MATRHWDTWRTPGKGWTVGYVDLKRGNMHDLFAKAPLADVGFYFSECVGTAGSRTGDVPGWVI